MNLNYFGNNQYEIGTLYNDMYRKTVLKTTKTRKKHIINVS